MLGYFLAAGGTMRSFSTLTLQAGSASSNCSATPLMASVRVATCGQGRWWWRWGRLALVSAARGVADRHPCAAQREVEAHTFRGS